MRSSEKFGKLKKPEDYFIMTTTGKTDHRFLALSSIINLISKSIFSYYRWTMYCPNLNDASAIIFGTTPTFDRNSDEFLKYELVEQFRTCFSSKNF